MEEKGTPSVSKVEEKGTPSVSKGIERSVCAERSITMRCVDVCSHTYLGGVGGRPDDHQGPVHEGQRAVLDLEAPRPQEDRRVDVGPVGWPRREHEGRAEGGWAASGASERERSE